MKRKKISAILTAAMLSISLLPVNAAAYDYDYETNYDYGYGDADDTGEAYGTDDAYDTGAEENSVQEPISGKIRIKGTAEVGETLSVDFSELSPAGTTEDFFNFTWFAARESDVQNDNYDEDLMTEIGYESEYDVVEEDAGYVIVVKIEAIDGFGLTGKMYAKTDVITGDAEESDDIDDDAGYEEPEDGFDNEWSDTDEQSMDSEDMSLEEWEELDSTDDDWTVLNADEDMSDDGWTDPDSEDTPEDDGWADSDSDDDGWVDSDDEETADDDFETDWDAQDQMLGVDGSDWEVFGGEGPDDQDTEPQDSEEDVSEGEDSDGTEWEELDDNDSEISDVLEAEDAPPEPNYEFSVDPLSFYFEEEEGYSDVSGTITVTNTGEEAFDLQASCTSENNFLQMYDEYGEVFSQTTLGAGEACTITVEVHEGLEARDAAYEGKIELSDGVDADTQTVDFTARILPAEPVAASVVVEVDGVESTDVDFGTWVKNDPLKYQSTITVVNKGEVPASVDILDWDTLQYFSVRPFINTGSYQTELQSGEDFDQFVLSPNYDELAAAEYPYTEELTLQINEEDVIVLQLSIQVEPEEVHTRIYTGVENPSPVGPLPNGITTNDLGLYLQNNVSNVTIHIEKDGVEEKKPVSVLWNTNPEDISYDPNSSAMQTFNVTGSFSLPNGVDNPNDLPLIATVKVVVAKAVQKNEVLEVRQPADVINQPNGISKRNLATRLPSVIQIKTSQNGWITVPVSWDLNGAAYDPAIKTAQDFWVYGQYSLPKGVTDPNNITQGGSTAVHVFVVAAPKKNNLIEIIDPDPLLNQPNGISRKELGAKIPTTVQIITSLNGTMTANVKWNYQNCPYDPKSQKAQNFIIQGTVILPEGVYNLNSIPLTTSISVGVNGRKARIADESQNTITGLDTKNGYLVGTPISFTAIGAGMDNNSPEVGDVRYVPAKWKITNTYEWANAPYTGQFKITQPGNYSLAVFYRREVYNGTAWVADGQVSQKNFSFRVYTNGPAPTVTPIVTQKPSVPTGDNTPIAMWIAILAVAAACIAGGIILFIKKRK